ncbi:MAG: creatininase family protein [Christensenellaceae bacterium]|nr:creatininase family protein [Christensenellaceae bacterium]
MRSVWLNELTWQDVDEYLKTEDTIIFPIGSTEQHGPAGPLGVDTYAAIAIAEDAAKKAGVLTTPPMWFGDSPHHLGFPGTISLTTETLVAVVKEVVKSLAKNGFKRFILINGHKSTNLAALTTACRALHEYELPEVKIALTDPLWLCRNAAEVKDEIEHHSGELEISHVYYKFPGLIKEEKLVEENVDLPGLFGDYIKGDLFGKSGPTVEVFWNSREQKAFAPTGSFSASTKASPEKGKVYHDNMVENLVKFIHWFKTFDIPMAD